MAVDEAPGEDEAAGEAAREVPGEGPPRYTGVISREPSEAPGERPPSPSNGMISCDPAEALGEARLSEHPAPYMFEQELTKVDE